MINFLTNIKEVTYYEDIRSYTDCHINWLLNLSSDIELFNIQSSKYIIDLKNFFKYPTESLSEFIETYDDWMKMRYSLARTYKSKDLYLNLEQYCEQFVLYLERVLSAVYKNIIEKTIEKQLIINRLLNKKFCFDLRHEVKSYLYNDSSIIYESFFNQKQKILLSY